MRPTPTAAPEMEVVVVQDPLGTIYDVPSASSSSFPSTPSQSQESPSHEQQPLLLFSKPLLDASEWEKLVTGAILGLVFGITIVRLGLFLAEKMFLKTFVLAFVGFKLQNVVELLGSIEGAVTCAAIGSAAAFFS